MFILYIIVFTLVALLLETVVVNIFIQQGGVKPDFILIITVYSGLFLSKIKATNIGFTLGLIQDALSFKMAGVNSLSKCLIGFFIGSLREKLLSENLTVQCLFTFIATLFNGIVFLFFSNLISSSEIEPFYFFKSLLIQGIYNLILAPLIFLVFNRIGVRYENRWKRTKFF